MCNGGPPYREKPKRGIGKRIQKLQGLAKVLHCPTRWDIIEIIGSETAKTREIRKGLEEKGYELTQSGLYYHLSELSDAGLIEVADYIEEGKGAPEKVWKLTCEKIEIDLVGSED